MTFPENLAAVQTRISLACTMALRPRVSVQLLAVTKTVSAEDIRAAASGGLRHFGENYLQEALPKMAALTELNLEWHYIGSIQSNKTADIARHFHWAHGIDRLKVAERLSAQRPAALPALQVCVQVNVAHEASKSGCSPEATAALCRAVAQLPGLRLRGLMALPAANDGPAAFRRLRQLFEIVQGEIPSIDTLSMGMSDDLEAAIAEGSTLVRVGSALFGARTASKPAANPAS